MPLIHNSGSPSSRIWVICDAPLSTDLSKGFLFSGGMGYIFRKMLEDAGVPDPYFTCRRPDTDDKSSFRIIESELTHYKPPFILAMDSVGSYLCPELRQAKNKKSHVTQLGKYVGSLLQAEKSLIDYEHYVMPIYDPFKFIQDWTERNITTYFDLQKLREEFFYWQKTGHIQPLPFRDLHFREMELDEVLLHLERFKQARLISVDIETCYPKGDSAFIGHPGYPITIGLADSKSFGLSIDMFRKSNKETIILWIAGSYAAGT